MVWEGYQRRLDKGTVASGPWLGAYQTDVFGEMSMAINRADITVATIQALADIHVAELEDGCWAFVDSVRAYFALLKNSGAVADGITIIVPNAGSPIAGAAGARWFRQATVDDAAWLDQAQWHINAVTGNDQNDGATSLTALQTWAELRRRLGIGPITHMTTVTIESDLPLSDPIIIDFEIDRTLIEGGLIVQGTRTVLHSGTFTAVAPYVPATNTPGSITDAALPVSWTASGLVGKLIVLTGRPVTDPLIGPPTGYVAVDLGAKTARFSPFLDITTQAGNTPVVPILGEAYSVVELTKVHGYVLSETTGKSGVLIQNLEVDGVINEVDGTQSLEVQSGFCFPVNCIFSGVGDALVIGGIVETDFSACRFSRRLIIQSGSNFAEGCLFEGQVVAINPAARLSLINPCLRQGVIPTVAGSIGIRARRTAYLVVQAPTPIFDVDIGASCAADAAIDLEDDGSGDPVLYGTGVNTIGIRIDSYGATFFDPAAPPTMAPAATQVLVGATATTYVLPVIEATTNAGYVTKYGY
jgi:hypothetical protein